MSIYVDITKEFDSFCLQSQFEADNEKLGILGGSGSGKSMTLKCIAGIITPDKGEIVLNDRILFSSKKKINLIPQERNTGFMFQSYALFPNMTVAQNILIGIRDQSNAEKNKILQSYLELFKLEDLESRYPSQLSGGQQQRVALARIMAKNPDILMLDEPFSALDAHLRFSIETEFFEALNRYSRTVIYVSHSIDEVYRFCDSTAIMHHGRIFEKDRTATLFQSPTTLEGAKLTGFKNISPIKKMGQTLVSALDWGISLETNSEVQDHLKYIAIREQDITIADSSEGDNSFELSIVGVKQSPFSTVLEVLPTKANTLPSKPLVCEYSKDVANRILEMEQQGALYGSIKKENILLLL